MAEGPGGGGPRGDGAGGGRAAEEEVVRRRCRRGQEAEAPRDAAAGPPVEERFRQMHLRKQVSYSSMQLWLAAKPPTPLRGVAKKSS
ncbi:hypothetical protein MG293_012137 [Ovis ammon polii]|nr:hypothetical protein MG293_012137 [Ovis ammon polii]KAI4564574.1 hypothetical protein MJT46_010372 [Ovis ammon polii x Ovis aries]